MKKQFLFLLLYGSILSAGCASNSPKHFDQKLGRLDKQGIVLATVTSENRLDKSDLIIPGAFVIKKDGKAEKEYVLYGSDHFRVFTKNNEICLIVLEVTKGDHYISSVRGVVQGDITLPVFEAKVYRNFQAQENEIIYIGNIHMVLRKKTSDSESDAGDHLLPWKIVHQISIAGATLDVKVTDEYERDIEEFETAFPNLKNYTVIKRILPLQPVQ